MSPPADPPSPTRRRAPRTLRFVRLLGFLSIFGTAALVAGFFFFVLNVPAAEPEQTLSGDGIVVVTGGVDRLGYAFDLLTERRAQRLLISGVNPSTTEAEIARLHPKGAHFLSCCVDLGFRALNTAGNALETREWARTHGFQRIIVVTSGWHMRRTLLEIQRSLPEVELIPHPVISQSTANEDWWREPDNLRILIAEYVKYLAAIAHVRIAPRIADEPVPAKPRS